MSTVRTRDSKCKADFPEEHVTVEMGGGEYSGASGKNIPGRRKWGRTRLSVAGVERTKEALGGVPWAAL